MSNEEPGARVGDRYGRLLREAVTRLAGQPADPGALAEVVAAGRFGEVLAALPRTDAAQITNATGRVAREHAKTALAPVLTGWLIAHLARAGHARWAHSWADSGGEVRMAPELKAEIEAVVAELTAVRPDATRLRALAGLVGAAT